MWRRIVLLLILTLVVAYLIAAVTFFNRRPVGMLCQGIELVIRDSAYAGFITEAEVKRLLKQQGIGPEGKEMDRIRTRTLEEVLAPHPLIDNVECYKTPDGHICVEVSQRIPLLRVMSDGGEDYYVDHKGRVMPTDAKNAARLVVATGHIDRAYATGVLYPFARYLQTDAFWQAQAEQLHVLADRTVELVPRVGDHIVYLGRLEQVEQKLDRLKRFYEQGLNKVGWNKYRRISVEFGNQVICTRRELKN